MEYQCASSGIHVSLPLTTPTGKVRVKRPRPGFSPEAVPSRREPIQAQDYLEWQISYDTDNLHEPSLVKKVVLQKDSGVRYGCELVRLLVEGQKLSLLSNDELKQLKSILQGSRGKGIEETEQIAQEITKNFSSHVGDQHGFKRYQLIVPNYIKKCLKYSVEIKIAHKQKAVGNQAMIFVNLPVEYCASELEKPIIGRPAERLEKINYLIDSTNHQLISDTVIAFAIASERHRRDMEMIFSALRI
jgi:hypothetical protein